MFNTIFVGVVLFAMSNVLFICINHLAFQQRFYQAQSSISSRFAHFGLAAIFFTVGLALTAPFMLYNHGNDMLPAVIGTVASNILVMLFYLAVALASTVLSSCIVKKTAREIDSEFCAATALLTSACTVLVVFAQSSI